MVTVKVEAKLLAARVRARHLDKTSIAAVENLRILRLAGRHSTQLSSREHVQELIATHLMMEPALSLARLTNTTSYFVPTAGNHIPNSFLVSAFVFVKD